MSKILQINYRLCSSVADFPDAAAVVANHLANVPGLVWKIWLGNESEREGGGIYLFGNEAALRNFIEGPIAEKLKNHPALENLFVKQFDVAVDLSAIPRADRRQCGVLNSSNRKPRNDAKPNKIFSRLSLGFAVFRFTIHTSQLISDDRSLNRVQSLWGFDEFCRIVAHFFDAP